MIDTHCHIHSHFFKEDPDDVIKKSVAAGVSQMICVGVDADDSAAAIEFVAHRPMLHASIGIHPHEAANFEPRLQQLQGLVLSPKVVAIGEIGLDYWYYNATKKEQELLLRAQLELAVVNNLPVIFHIRGSKEDPHDAFEDAFAIIDDYSGVRGVVHSFTAGQKSLAGVLSRSFAVGVNGIATFTKDDDMLRGYQHIPTGLLVLETDAPFLTPVPKRGMVNTPEYMGYTADFLATLRGESREELVAASTRNAKRIFGI